MKFDLKRPCAHCPFRTDIRPYLHGARAQEIVDSMIQHDGYFPCHKTIEHDDEGEGVVLDTSQHCAGATILLEKIDRPNQAMRFFERLGHYDRTALDMDSPVFDTPEAFVDACRRAD